MTDWRAMIRARLAGAGLVARGAEEQIEELAGHAEDLAADASASDPHGEEAARRALCEATDWHALAREIETAQEEETMNERVRRVWLPGVAAVMLAHGLWTILTAAGLRPAIIWDGWHPLMFLFLQWLFLLPLVGAMAAYWSHRCGGSQRELWIASLLPALAMAGYLLLPTIAVFFVDLDIPLGFKLKVAFWRGYFGLVLLPAALLSLGVLPFLRKRVAA